MGTCTGTLSPARLPDVGQRERSHSPAAPQRRCDSPKPERRRCRAELAGCTRAKAEPIAFGPGAATWGSFLWLAITMGALSVLTPCVFPMVPITVSYFTKHAAATRGRAIASAALYGLGIVLTFTLLGSLVAAVAGAAGLTRLAASPWVLAITAVVKVRAEPVRRAANCGCRCGCSRLDGASRRRARHPWERCRWRCRSPSPLTCGGVPGARCSWWRRRRMAASRRRAVRHSPPSRCPSSASRRRRVVSRCALGPLARTRR